MGVLVLKKDKIYELFKEIWGSVDQSPYDYEIVKAFSYMPSAKLIEFMKELIESDNIDNDVISIL